MKVGKNTPTDNQERYLDYLMSQGYATAICYGWDQARDVIVNYLNSMMRVTTDDLTMKTIDGVAVRTVKSRMIYKCPNCGMELD